MGNSGDMLYRDSRDRVRRAVAELLKDTGLRVRELTYELLITNPRDPEKGQIHVSYEDGSVSWERVVWDHWGYFESYAGAADSKVSVAEIIKTLSGPQGLA